MPSIETRYGQFEVPATEDDLIGSFLSRYGEWAWDEVCFVASNIPPGARVLDVGAYLGTFGLGLSLRQRLSDVCFVDANPNVAPFLRENVRRLKRQPSHVVSALVCAGGQLPSSGRIEGSNWGSLSFAAEASADLFGEEPESYVTLAELRDQYGPFDLIKLDVEGMERDLIQSDADFFRSGSCQLWVECNESASSLELAGLLLSLGLEVFYFAFPSYNPNNYRNDPDPIYPFAYEAGLLSGRNLNPSLDSLLVAHQCILYPIRSVEDLRNALWRTPRWGRREWEGKSASETTALAGRMMLGQEYANFLHPDAPAAEWKGKEALIDHMRITEGRLHAHVAALEAQLGGSQDDLIRSLVDREGGLRAELQSQVELRERFEVEVEELRRLVGERVGQIRSLEARLSEVRAIASERLFQLSVVEPRTRSAEAAAANAQARMLQALHEVAQERDRLSAEREAFEALKQAQERASERASEKAAERAAQSAAEHAVALEQAHERIATLEAQLRARRRGKLRTKIEATSFYQNFYRPYFKRLRRIANRKKYQPAAEQ